MRAALDSCTGGQQAASATARQNAGAWRSHNIRGACQHVHEDGRRQCWQATAAPKRQLIGKGEARTHARRTGGPGPHTGLRRAGQNCGGDRRARAGADAPADRPWPPPPMPQTRAALIDSSDVGSGQTYRWPSLPNQRPRRCSPSLQKLVDAAPCAAALLCCLTRMARLPQVAPGAQGACRSGMWREGKNSPKHSRTECRVQVMPPTAARVADRGGRREPGDPKHATHTHNGAAGSRTRSRASPCGSAFPAGARAPRRAR